MRSDELKFYRAQLEQVQRTYQAREALQKRKDKEEEKRKEKKGSEFHELFESELKTIQEEKEQKKRR